MNTKLIHFLHFDPHFCGSTEPFRQVAITPDKVTCPACLAKRTNFYIFTEVYTEELGKAVLKYPEEYVWPVEDVPNVAAKMIEAFRRGSYNKDSRAIKATCKRLNIKHTYREINAYLNG